MHRSSSTCSCIVRHADVLLSNAVVLYDMQMYCIKCCCIVSNAVVLYQYLQLYYITCSCIMYCMICRCIGSNAVVLYDMLIYCIKYSCIVSNHEMQLYCIKYGCIVSLAANVLSNFVKPLCTSTFFCETFYPDSSVFGTTCM